MSLRYNLNVLGKKVKYKSFSVPIKKENIKIDKDGNKTDETISYKIKFIDSTRFMVSSSSNRVNNLTEGIHEIKCKDCDCFLEYENGKDNLIIYKSLSCVIQKNLMKNLKRNSRIYSSFLIMTSINLFCC